MKKLLFLSVFAAFQFAAAQKTIALEKFTELAISGNIEITLIKSSENKLVIKNGDSNRLNVLTEEGGLALSTDSSEKFKVEVYHNNAIENIAVSGNVTVHSKDKMKTKNLEINVSGGSEIDIMVDADNITMAAASGSEIKLSGTAKHLEAAIASGAELSADKLKTETNTTVIASGGEASIYATVEVTATVASGGELNIHGNPKKINETKADGAEINRVR